MNEIFRPYTLGEILDRTAQLYRRNFLLFAGVAAVPTGVLVAVFLCFGALLGFVRFAAKATMLGDASSVLLVVGLLLIGLPVGIAATVASHAALTRTAVTTHMGEPPTIRGAFKKVWPRFWRYVWLMILQIAFAALIPGAVATVIVSILAYFGFRAENGTVTDIGTGVLAILVVLAVFVYIVWRALGYSMAMAVCVVEGKPAIECLRRSVKLSAGTRGRIFVMGLLVWAISIVLSILAYIPVVIVVAAATAAGHGAEYAAIIVIVAEILNVFFNFVLQALVTPVYMIALVLFYYDQRIRAEGYDIEFMMERAGLNGVGTVAGVELPISSEAVKG
jgi:hypothetical protein